MLFSTEFMIGLINHGKLVILLMFNLVILLHHMFNTKNQIIHMICSFQAKILDNHLLITIN